MPAEKAAVARRSFLNQRLSAIKIGVNQREKISVSTRKPLYLFMHENEITFLIRGAIFKVYNTLGPGLLESSYEAAMGYELIKSGLNVEHQVGLPMIYEELKLDVGYRIDLLVEKKVIIEIKSVETLAQVHYKQLVTYLRLSDLRVGLLVNFNTTDISKSIHRRVNDFKD
jgi:GxxExxY protein